MQPDIAFDLSVQVSTTEFDYDEIDSRLGLTSPCIDSDSTNGVEALREIVKWLRNSNNARAKEIKIQALYYFLNPSTDQVKLAREIGATKAAICQKAVEFKDHFKLHNPGGAACNMRSDEARKTFSKICKSNHEKRKKQSSLTESQTTSTTNSVKQLTLRERVLELATQPCAPLSPAANS